MKCPCGAKLRCLETRALADGAVSRRRYLCGSCGGRYSTYEVPEAMYKVAKYRQEQTVELLQRNHARRVRNKSVLEKLRAGVKREVIAAEHGICPTAVRYIAKTHGLKARGATS